MTVYFSAAVNLAGATYATAHYHVHCKKVLKNDCRMFMLDSRCRRSSMQLVQNEVHLAWAAEPLRMWYAFCIYTTHVTTDQRNKLRRIVNISAEIMRRETSFTDIMQSVDNYEWAFEDAFAVSLNDAQILNIVADLLSLKLLAAMFMAIYAL